MEPVAVSKFGGPVRAAVTIPGSKSYTNRALVIAAMTQGTVRIVRPLGSDDTKAMLGCLRTLGVEVRETADSWDVVGDVSDVKDREYDLDADLSGVTIRFLVALSCVVPGVQVLHGKESLNKRPIGELVEGLRQLGADIEYLGQDGFPPVRVRSSVLSGDEVVMFGAVSSQYFSAILQITPLLNGGLVVRVGGEQISKPYIDMTIDTMREFGVVVVNNNYRTYTVAGGQQYTARDYQVEGDFSSASYFFAVAALTGSTVTVRNVNPHSAQADRRFLDMLGDMGSRVVLGDNNITVTGGGVRAGAVDMTDCPDQAMTMAVLAAFADGKTTISGVQSLRVKETERVVAVETELSKMGIRATSTPDTLTIHGGKPKAAVIDTYGDHRMAMAFAVAGTKLSGVVINDPGVVSKTFPEFWSKLAGLTRTNIVFIGMRGTGKSTVGAILAKRLGKAFIDMDAEIVQASGMSVTEMVRRHGWEHFRNAESVVAAAVGGRTGQVISSGGGVVLRPENVAALGESGLFVLLEAPTDVLAARIAGETDRAALTNQPSVAAELAEVWRQREDLYRRVADLTVASGDRTPEDVAGEIYGQLEGKSK